MEFGYLQIERNCTPTSTEEFLSGIFGGIFVEKFIRGSYHVNKRQQRMYVVSS